LVLASEAYASSHLFPGSLIIQITILDNLDRRQLFPDGITDEVGGIEVKASLHQLIDLSDLIWGQLGPNHLARTAHKADICAHARYIG
jgi:hypothetical protein